MSGVNYIGTIEYTGAKEPVKQEIERYIESLDNYEAIRPELYSWSSGPEDRVTAQRDLELVDGMLGRLGVGLWPVNIHFDVSEEEIAVSCSQEVEPLFYSNEDSQEIAQDMIQKVESSL